MSLSFQRLILALGALSIFCLLGCGGGGGGVNGGEDNSNGGNSTELEGANFRVTTFNAALLPSFSALTDQRVSPVAAALASFNSDVLCIQEVWRQSDLRTLQNALAVSFPHQYSVTSRQKFADHSPVCSTSEVQPLFLCLAGSCLNETSSFVDCAVASCRSAVFDLATQDPQCASALFAQAGKSISDLFSIQDELFNSAKRARLFAFDGSSGLLLVSRLPLENVQTLDFYDTSTTSRRAAIFATATVNGKAQHIGCTHLTSNLDGLLPYTGSLGSWQNEGFAQVQQMIAFAGSYSQGGAQYLAGDFNCSIADGANGVREEAVENCQAFTAAGYRDPAAESLGCTFCGSNALNQLNDEIAGSTDTQLDHVFVRDLLPGPLAIQIVLNGPIDAGGQSVPPSDHYGLRFETVVP